MSLADFDGWRILGWADYSGQRVRLLEHSGMLCVLAPGTKTALRVELVAPGTDAVAEAYRKGVMTAVALVLSARSKRETGQWSAVELPDEAPIMEEWFGEAVALLQEDT